jgi:hypothetical protein
VKAGSKFSGSRLASVVGLGFLLSACEASECLISQCTQEGINLSIAETGAAKTAAELAFGAAGPAGPGPTFPVAGSPLAAVEHFLAAEAARESSYRQAAIWDGCYASEIGRRDDCNQLSFRSFGRIGLGIEYRINDTKIWTNGNTAVASVHITEMEDDPEGLNTGARTVCLRSLEAERRGSIWKILTDRPVWCNSFESWNGKEL